MQLDDVFKMIFEVHKEYNSMLQPDAQEADLKKDARFIEGCQFIISRL